MGVRILTCEFLGDIHIRTIATTYLITMKENVVSGGGKEFSLLFGLEREPYQMEETVFGNRSRLNESNLILSFKLLHFQLI